MRRLARLRHLPSPSPSSSPLSPLSPSSSLCRHVPNLSSSQRRRQLSVTPKQDKESPSERLRRQIWKDTPPGPKDPYSESARQSRVESEIQLTHDDEAQWLDEQGAAAAAAAAAAEDTGGIAVPPEMTTAPVPADIVDPQYRPAVSWDGLETVGDLRTWWDAPGHWTAELEFRGFGPAEVVRDRSVLEARTRQAVVEALALRAAGREAELIQSWANVSGQAEAAAAVAIRSTDGVPALEGDVAAVAEGLLEAEGEPSVGADAVPATLDPAVARQLAQSWDGEWRKVALDDARLKFAVTKRVLQLTGHVISDARQTSIQTVQHLLAIIVRPPKPKKLVEELHLQGTLEQLPNVTVYDRRVTPIDKEKMVGRWKIIERELVKRGLPVTGHDRHDKIKEDEWSGVLKG